jgi:hypothetical protein
LTDTAPFAKGGDALRERITALLREATTYR